MKSLPQKYYKNDDVLFLSRDLLGKFLITHFDGELTGGIITETEAYRAPEDRASHAFGGRRTPRNEVMYQIGGTCYVYRCYGIHALFNVVTNDIEIPHAILIRAIEPIEGISVMLRRRGKERCDKTLCGGPGTLTEALGIKIQHNGLPLTGPEIWIEDRSFPVCEKDIVAGPRIGVSYAGEHALLPWRFRLKIK